MCTVLRKPLKGKFDWKRGFVRRKKGKEVVIRLLMFSVSLPYLYVIGVHKINFLGKLRSVA